MLDNVNYLTLGNTKREYTKAKHEVNFYRIQRDMVILWHPQSMGRLRQPDNLYNDMVEKKG